MLVGGFFLYVSYYGCNQTQVQRQLAAKDNDDTNMALFLNGVLRFPIVLAYCFMGVAVGAFATSRGDFLEMLPLREVVENGVAAQVPNFNMAVPVFVLEYLPHGAIGLIIVALFAAAMSSLDSTLNSLSATTVRDVIDRFFKPTKTRSQRQQLVISKGTTVFWGVACVTFSFFVGGMSDSIIVTINKIGSLVNGPLLATFLLAILTKRTNDRGAVIGILAGFSFNLFLWVAVPGVSWLWWNAIGCGVTFAVGYGASLLMPVPLPANLSELTWSKSSTFDHKKNWTVYYALLVAYFILMMVVLLAI
jgi:SSS family solute:Na+ symporter